MPWKPEYEANRQARMAANPEFAQRVAEQRRRGLRTPEENRAYMREYYRANRERWTKRTPEQQAQYNETRRRKYAEDVAYREHVKRQSRESDPVKKRDSRMRRQFGIGAAEFDAMVKRQGGGCGICGAAVGDGSGRRLHVDHCHDTGRVRGVLCSECNLGLGKFRDDPERIRRALTYLTGAVDHLGRPER